MFLYFSFVSLFVLMFLKWAIFSMNFFYFVFLSNLLFCLTIVLSRILSYIIVFTITFINISSILEVFYVDSFVHSFIWISTYVNFSPVSCILFLHDFSTSLQTLSDHGNDDEIGEFRFRLLLFFKFSSFCRIQFSLFTWSFLNEYLFFLFAIKIRNRIDKFYFQISIKVTFLTCKIFLALVFITNQSWFDITF